MNTEANPVTLAKKWLGVLAALMALAPWFFDSPFAHAVLTQIGIAMVACLSFNILLGQGGMLSFGHAVYTGLGAYMAMHVLRWSGTAAVAVPIVLIPLVGGLCGMGFAVILGFVTTRKSGTTFAMITLGMAELVFALALMLPEFFGGEAGLSGNRMQAQPIGGMDFKSQHAVYVLIAAYTWVCVGLMFALTQTPLGRLLNAVRDNAERLSFMGYQPQRVRYLAFIIAGFFAGVSGGMGVVHHEIVSAEVLGASRSGAYLLFTFLGGVGYFVGPMLGAVGMVAAAVLWSEWSAAWLLHLGLLFMGMVLWAPGGLASIAGWHWQWMRHTGAASLWPWFGALLACAALAGLGALSAMEFLYHHQLHTLGSQPIRWLGMSWATDRLGPWLAAASALALGLLGWVYVKKHWDRVWMQVMASTERGGP